MISSDDYRFSRTPFVHFSIVFKRSKAKETVNQGTNSGFISGQILYIVSISPNPCQNHTLKIPSKHLHDTKPPGKTRTMLSRIMLSACAAQPAPVSPSLDFFSGTLSSSSRSERVYHGRFHRIDTFLRHHGRCARRPDHPVRYHAKEEERRIIGSSIRRATNRLDPRRAAIHGTMLQAIGIL